MKNSALAILNAGLWADMAFFAADIGATGGGMRGLSLRGLVAWTGQTRIEYVIIGKDADGMPITRQDELNDGIGYNYNHRRAQSDRRSHPRRLIALTESRDLRRSLRYIGAALGAAAIVMIVITLLFLCAGIYPVVEEVSRSLAIMYQDAVIHTLIRSGILMLAMAAGGTLCLAKCRRSGKA